MDNLRQQVAALPTLAVNGHHYLSYQAVTDTVAAFLFPDQASSQIDAEAYQHILETADTLCRELGYQEVIRLTPPKVALNQMGLYWSQSNLQPATEPTVAAPTPAPGDILYENEAEFYIVTGSGRVEMLQSGQLYDVRLHQWGLEEVTRQHFKIPVMASEAVLALMERAVNGPGAAALVNDYRGLWHDILGMCITGGQDVSKDERLFTVIIRGVGQRRYWQFRARLLADGAGDPFLLVDLADKDKAELPSPQLQPDFELGHVGMTPGVAALGIDVRPYLKRHAHKDWGNLSNRDKRENNYALKHGLRILSAYDVPLPDGESVHLWVITEADRSATTFLLPSEY
jgi:hypothetical protein